MEYISLLASIAFIFAIFALTKKIALFEELKEKMKINQVGLIEKITM
jgi:hypothetical protein